MSIVINGTGSISGISVGGLPDSIVDAGTLATNSVDSAELIDGAVDNSHMAAMAASKLTGALPAISAANLTAIPAANITGTLPAISGANLTGITTGKVLQVVHAMSATEVATNGDTYADTGLTANITPSATSSKILFFASNDCTKHGGDTSVAIRAYRGSTEIGGTIIGRRICDTDDGGKSQSVFSFAILDSPSSTSQLTYKTQYNNTYAAGTVRINAGSGSSTMYLMEIGV